MYSLPKSSCSGVWYDLQEKRADYDSYCMLAEAYMTLQEPDKAATAYEVGCTKCVLVLRSASNL